MMMSWNEKRLFEMKLVAENDGSRQGNAISVSMSIPTISATNLYMPAKLIECTELEAHCEEAA